MTDPKSHQFLGTDVTTGKPLEVLHSSPTVGNDVRWVVTIGPNGNYSVRKIEKGVESIAMTGLKTLARAKQVCEQKVIMFRLFDRPKR
jgi:hypothetical protein